MALDAVHEPDEGIDGQRTSGGVVGADGRQTVLLDLDDGRAGIEQGEQRGTSGIGGAQRAGAPRPRGATGGCGDRVRPDESRLDRSRVQVTLTGDRRRLGVGGPPRGECIRGRDRQAVSQDAQVGRQLILERQTPGLDDGRENGSPCLVPGRRWVADGRSPA
ncbi:MAG: hypothetical protein ACHQ02_03840, partial [Candidatus Limnocylindrales bacterium]